MADHAFSHDPSSSSTSPKLEATRAPAMYHMSDDENEAGAALHGSDSGTQSSSGEDEHDHHHNHRHHFEGLEGAAVTAQKEEEHVDEELEDGLLPRDRPHKTAFYDPIADRQMSQSDAKLFYQRSQLDLKTMGGPGVAGSWGQMGTSPQGSPTMTAGTAFEKGAAATVPHGTEARGPAGSGYGQRNPDGGAHTGIEGPMENPVRRDAGLYNVEAAQRSQPGPGIPNNHPGLPPAAMANPAAHAHLLETMGEPDGIGSTTFLDADTQVTSELSIIFKNIQKVLDIRHKYIHKSLQGPLENPKDDPGWPIYPPPPEPAWAADREIPTGSRANNSVNNSMANSMVLDPKYSDGFSPRASEPDPSRQASKKRKPGQEIGEDFDMDDLLPLPNVSEMDYILDGNGVYQVFESGKTAAADSPIVSVPTIREWYIDLEAILSLSSDGPSKSFAFRRLQYLEGKFNLYCLLNEYQETADSKRVPHRDFYNVRKVDTHVHHSACMNQKHLLRFIKSKMKKCPDEVVLFRDGKHLTLAEVFQSINLTAYDLSIDTLDMHAHTDSFHRFDKFNLKYNPIGESRLRTIFLKTENFINGRYLAEITKEVIADLESSKYQMVEWRISIYGKSLDEWDMLAAWVVDNKLFSHNVRWLIQIPRLYDVYKASGLMETYEQVVKNVFQPLFEVTKDPNSHPKLHVFLQRVIGFDSVDDESKVERRVFRKYPIPNEWNGKQNPPYSYWIYYLYANMVSLNAWRKQRGFNTFLLRPHCGEAGDSEHLAVAVLCCHSISHGLLLRKVPLLQYIFYLEQIGIAMSPLSNNALFLAYERNPFHQYFKRGLNVSLSTDDPLQFAFTKEPLIEEYAVAAQINKLSPVDMCELAKNSVKQSGYEFSVKQQWLGPSFHLPGAAGNTMVKTNIPDRREEFRYRTLLEEQRMVERYTSIPSAAEAATATPATGGARPAPASPTSSTKTPTVTSSTLPGSANDLSRDSKQQQQQQQQGNASSPFSFASRVPSQHQLQGSSHQIQTDATTSSAWLINSAMPPSPAVGPTTLASSSDPGAAGITSSWPADVIGADLHLSGHEPTYFPGVITRSQRRNSLKRGSIHESDVNTGGGGYASNGPAGTGGRPWSRGVGSDTWIPYLPNSLR